MNLERGAVGEDGGLDFGLPLKGGVGVHKGGELFIDIFGIGPGGFIFYLAIFADEVNKGGQVAQHFVNFLVHFVD